jgi:glycosyltransferase involved in cell wall biosynthesis
MTTERFGILNVPSACFVSLSAPVPRFSIIVPCYFSYETLAGCLASLAEQRFTSFEVIVVDSTPGGRSLEEFVAPYRWARGYVHGERLGAHAARNLGAGMATGEVIAFVDPDMTADREWLERLEGRLREGKPVVGGGVDCPAGYWARAVHLTKYGWWLSGGRGRGRTQLPSGNLCLARSLFLAAGGFPDRYWEGDTELSYRLRERWEELWHEPAARTVHLDIPSGWAFLRERFSRGWDTALARRRRHGWGRAERALRTAAAPMVWAVMLGRSAAMAARAGWAGRWVASLPVVGAGLAWWVAGECGGYWTQEG